MGGETSTLAWLCEYLPRFRAAAGNRTRLERIVAEVAAGRRSAEWACKQLGAGESWFAWRATEPGPDLASLGRLNIDPVVVSGDYVCPYGWCERTGQPDDRGREPICHLGANPVPMRFRGR